jgi:hypothetical protein
LKTPTPVLETVKGLFQIGDSMGLGDLDLSALVNCYEQWINKRITSYEAAGEPGRELAAAAEAAPMESPSSDRRRSDRLALNIPLKLSVYQWEREGAFSGQLIEGTLCDLSDNGLLISSAFPLAHDMFVVIHFPQDSDLPPVTGRIIRIETVGATFRYGCMLAGLAPYQRLQLESYISRQAHQSS